MLADFTKMNGLIAAVVQDAATAEVLMLGFMNGAALERTLATGEVTFYSRSRDRLWVKGESSGHKLRLRELLLDCDGDAVLVRVVPTGPGVCHEGFRTCFFRKLESADSAVVVGERAFDPAAVYGGTQ